MNKNSNNTRPRVYVAGAYSGATVLEILDNMRIGMKAAKDLLRNGFAPYCPWLDYHYQLMLGDDETLTVDDYHRYSLSWLAVADAMLVVDNPRNIESKGLRAEIECALANKIPVWYMDGDTVHREGQPGRDQYWLNMPIWMSGIVTGGARTVAEKPTPVDYVGLTPMDDDCPIAEDDQVLNAFGRFDSKCDDIIRSRSVHNVGTSPAEANTIEGILDPVTSYLGHHQECTQRLYSAIRRKAPVDEQVELVCDAVNYLRFLGTKLMEGEKHEN